MDIWMIEKNSMKHHYLKKKMQITDVDYTHAKRICKDFEIKDLGEYHDLHVQINAL